MLLKKGNKKALVVNQYIKAFGQQRALFVVPLSQSHFLDFVQLWRRKETQTRSPRPADQPLRLGSGSREC